MPRVKPVFQNSPLATTEGLQSALLRYIQGLHAYLDGVDEDVQGLIDGGSAPTGAAGGDLGGTYPDPDVAAIHETSGPTKLTVGAIATGQFTKRVGTTFIGGTPPDTQPVSLRGFRSKDQGGAYVNGTTRVHVAGYANTGGVFTASGVQALQGIGAGQMAYAIPEYFPRAGVINRLVTRTNGTTGSAGTPNIRMAVYADATLAAGALAGSPYPGARLGQSAIIDMWQGGANKILESVGLSIAVAAGTHVWFTVMYNAQAVTNQHTIPALGFLYPILGFTFNPAAPTTIATDAATGGVGWRHAVTFATSEDFPDPFPQSSPTGLGDTTTIPVIGYGFQQT